GGGKGYGPEFLTQVGGRGLDVRHRLSARQSAGDRLRRAELVPETLRRADALRVPSFSLARTTARGFAHAPRRRSPPRISRRLLIRIRPRASGRWRPRRTVPVAALQSHRAAATPRLPAPCPSHRRWLARQWSARRR